MSSVAIPVEAGQAEATAVQPIAVPWRCDLCGYEENAGSAAPAVSDVCVICDHPRVRQSEKPIGEMTDHQLAEERRVWRCGGCGMLNGSSMKLHDTSCIFH